ncbi:MAG TPA: recombination mediator RecR [Elusimicrobiota bacterium]|nr:recombination mediator RecR [Elusimicrobiota bacterium]
MKSVDRLVAALKRLPGIGPKQAERLTIHLLRSPRSEVENLVEALREAKAALRFCSKCGDMTDAETCRICSDPARDQTEICVVEEPQDVAAIERTRAFSGLYHVLHGSLSPLDGVGPDRIKVRELVERVRASNGAVKEVVIATDPDTEGEATAIYLGQQLKPFPVKVTRIAHGVPLGGDLDYIDERTLSHALSGRREL